MARENFIKFKEPMKTKIEYFCCDDKEFFPKDSEVVLYEYNRWKDVRDNPTSKLEKEFLARGAMVETDSDYSMVFLGNVKINGKWEEHIFTDFEVPYNLIMGYVVFWEIRPAQKYRWIKLDKNGKPRFGEEKETSWTPTLKGLGYTEYDWFGKEIYEDEESIDALMNKTTDGILHRELGDEEKLQLAIKGWLEIFGHPYITIGEPPKEVKKRRTNEKYEK